jgi:hypothetical protein
MGLVVLPEEDSKTMLSDPLLKDFQVPMGSGFGMPRLVSVLS